MDLSGTEGIVPRKFECERLSVRPQTVFVTRTSEFAEIDSESAGIGLDVRLLDACYASAGVRRK